MFKGLLPRHRSRYPVAGSAPFTTTAVPLIDRSAWPDLIADMERSKSSLRHLAESEGLSVYDQQRTNYCHGNSPAFALSLLRIKQNQPRVELSAASIAGPVAGFKNRGAAIVDDLAQIVNVGCAETRFYPTNYVGRRYWNRATIENCALHKCEEWFDCPPTRIFDAVISLVLSCIPVCLGYWRWMGEDGGHAVTGVAAKMERNRVGIEIGNSWGPAWSDRGYLTLWEDEYGVPDEAYSPRATTAS